MKIFIPFLLILTLTLQAQKEANMWCFGNQSGINFNGGSPILYTTSAMYTSEGCASISDANGNLLFYTNGVSAWDKTDNIMPGSAGLKGGAGTSSTQAALIVPKPGSTTIYYIFTTDEEAGSKGLNYSTVDMTGNGGKGIITGTTPTPLQTPVTEKLTAVKHCNGTDFWVIAHGWNNNTFWAYLVDNTGVSASPIISNIGTIHAPSSGSPVSSHGAMKASPDGKKIALAIVGNAASKLIELFDFDNSTGAVSNPLTLEAGNNLQGPYGVEFSPDNSKLYVGCVNAMNIYQYDLSAGSNAAIIASKTDIQTHGMFIDALQLAPDGKIYVASTGNDSLGVINSPNLAGNACNYARNGFWLGGKMAGRGLPNFIQSYFGNISSYGNNSSVTICIGDSATLTASGNGPYSWSPATNINTTTGASVKASPSVNTTYYVSHTNSNGCPVTDSIKVTVASFIVAYAGNDFSVCDSSLASLSGSSSFNGFYQWRSSSGNILSSTDTASFIPSTSDNIIFSVTSGSCYDEDTLYITVNPLPVISFITSSFAECAPICVDFTNTNNTLDPNTTSFYWDFGDNTNSSTNPANHCYFSPGNYSILLKVRDANSCTDSLVIPNMIQVFANPTASFSYSPLPVAYTNTPIDFTDLSLGSSAINAWEWQFGDVNNNFSSTQNPTFSYTSEGTFLVSLIVKDINGCSDTAIATIDVTGEPTIFIPNSFTPNSDGLNDSFFPVLNNYDLSFVRFYDRWGQLIYETTSAANGWDGKIAGEEAQEDVYLYLIKYGSKSEIGKVTLIR